MATEEDVRRIALSLPEVTEKPWVMTPGFRVKDKSFLRIRSEAEGGLVVFVSDLEEKKMLLASDPGKFFTTPALRPPRGCSRNMSTRCPARPRPSCQRLERGRRARSRPPA